MFTHIKNYLANESTYRLSVIAYFYRIYKRNYSKIVNFLIAQILLKKKCQEMSKIVRVDKLNSATEHLVIEIHFKTILNISFV